MWPCDTEFLYLEKFKDSTINLLLYYVNTERFTVFARPKIQMETIKLICVLYNLYLKSYALAM